MAANEERTNDKNSRSASLFEFFDEMTQLPKSERELRYRLAVKFKARVDAFLAAQLADLLTGKYLQEHTSNDYREELFDLYLTMYGEAGENGRARMYEDSVTARAGRFSDYIEDTTEKTVQSAMLSVMPETGENGAYGDLFQLGVPMDKEDIPVAVRRVFSAERGTEIAQNEANWIYNDIGHDLLKKQGQATHTWVSMRDEKVRVSHMEADGQTVPIDEPFLVGGYYMLYPLDDSLGAPASETVNCRCVEI